jgi:hypothetical protein
MWRGSSGGPGLSNNDAVEDVIVPGDETEVTFIICWSLAVGHACSDSCTASPALVCHPSSFSFSPRTAPVVTFSEVI